MFSITHEYFRHLKCKNDLIKIIKNDRINLNLYKENIPKSCSSHNEVIKIIKLFDCSKSK